jgi:hypothetical protein
MLVTILTTNDIARLNRCVNSFKEQTCKDFELQIVVNTLNSEYEKEVLSLYPQAIVTESNGTPGKGKNSVVNIWRKNTSHEFFSMIDGDDFASPYYVESLYEHIQLHPDIDYLGSCGTEVIRNDYTPHLWETSDRDPRPSDPIADCFKKDFVKANIKGHDRFVLASKRGVQYLMFFEHIKVFEDYILSLKMLQLFREKAINYYITTSVDLCIYDRSSEDSITSHNDDWEANFDAMEKCLFQTINKTWSSLKGVPLIKPKEKMSYNERLNFIEKNIISPILCFSYGTDIEKAKYLIKSAQRFKYPLTYAGNGETYEGHGKKINKLKKFCEEQDPEQLILFLDAYDTAFIRPYKDFIKATESFDLENKVIFNSERNCWPDAELIPWYKQKYTKNSYKFLNSGVVLGKAKNILKIIPEEVPIAFDDQRYYTHYQVYQDKNNLIDLDIDCALFNTLAFSVKSIGFDGDMLYNTETKNFPFLLHANFNAYVEETLSLFYGMTTLIEIPTEKKYLMD